MIHNINTINFEARLKRAIIKKVILIEAYKILLSDDIRLAITKVKGAKTLKDIKKQKLISFSLNIIVVNSVYNIVLTNSIVIGV